MNYVDFLEESAKSPSVPFMEFLRSQAPGTLHMFVEGIGDIAFYRHFVLQYYSQLSHIRIHECGGKDAVYDTREAINNRSSQPEWASSMILLFFVDRDLSGFLENNHVEASDVFVTDFYSIENYVVSDDMVGIVLSDMFTFPPTIKPMQQEIEEIKHNFNEQLEVFYGLIKPVMAWGLYHKGKRTNFSFSDVNLNKLVVFINDLEVKSQLPSKYSNQIEVLDDMCEVSSEAYTKETEQTILALFSNQNPKLYIRGKFELWFFHRFMSQLAKTLRQRTGQKIKYKDNLMNQDDLMISLGPRVHPIPNTLAEFLSRNIPQKKNSKLIKKSKRMH